MNQELIATAVNTLAETPIRLRDLFERMDPAKIRIKPNPVFSRRWKTLGIYMILNERDTLCEFGEF